MRTIIKVGVCLALSIAFLTLLVPNVAADRMVNIEDAGNISWILICTALVFIMTPGVALFYGGMLRKQSMTSIMAQTTIVIGIMTVSWVLIGYTLAFGTDIHGIIGNLEYVLMRNLSYDTIADGATIPNMEFMLFQMMFALITAGIVLGACIERVRFNAIAMFIAVWSVLVYAPMAHWVWGGGLFAQYLTVLDFAGGTVVHICAATTGLALVLFAGKRSERIMKDRPNNVPMAFLGCALLWMGWFGFNGGSGLAANGIAINAIVVTQISAAFAMITWAIIQYMHVGRVNVLGMIAGAVAGLVAITPAAGYVGPTEAIVIGIGGGLLCYVGVIFMRKKSGLDDALDVFGVHGIGGIWGSIATGIFALPAMVPAGYEGLIYGNTDLFLGQIVAVISTLVFCFVVSYLIIWVISKLMKVTMDETEEIIGADIIEHGEPSYRI
ncbi:MAG: ammonium transporter [Candidatus Methanomethylophilaceae archaeon]